MATRALKQFRDSDPLPHGTTIGQLRKYIINIVRKKTGLTIAEDCCADIPDGQILRKSADGTLYQLSTPPNGGGPATWTVVTI